MPSLKKSPDVLVYQASGRRFAFAPKVSNQELKAGEVLKIQFQNLISRFVARVGSLRQADPHTLVCKSILNIWGLRCLENWVLGLLNLWGIECFKYQMFDQFKRC